MIKFKAGLTMLLLVAFAPALAVTPAITLDTTSELRRQPQGEVVRTLLPSTRVQLVEISDGWAQVILNANRPNEQLGWLPADQVEITGTSALETSINRNFVAKGQDCAWHRQHRAKVCVNTQNATLDCRKSYPGGPWKRCKVQINTELFSELKPGVSADAKLECDVRIEFKEDASFTWQEQQNTETATLTLNAGERRPLALNSDFTFGTYTRSRTSRSMP